MFNFSKNETLINSNWFVQDDKNYFKNEGGEGLLAVYLNLQKFIRSDQFKNKNDEEKYYLTSLEQLYKAVNEHKRKMKLDDIIYYLKILIDLNVVEIISHNNFKEKYKSDISKRELLIIKDLDYRNSKFYMRVPLDIVDYMIKNSLTYKHVALFLLMSKWANNLENKCYVSVNKLADWIGYSNKTVLKYYEEFNKLGIVASYKKINKDGQYYYNHYILQSMAQYDDFYKAHKKVIDKYK